MKDEILKELEQLLHSLGISVSKIEVKNSGRGITLAVDTPDSGIITGNHGEVLDALTYILRRIIDTKFVEDSARDISLDINGYKEAQAERLRGVARMLAERAKMFKHDVEMEPMTAYERLVIHSAFENDPHIKTESHGEGKFRRVVIKYVEVAEESGAEAS
jgi:spoIIIJ-associated protein